jgi:desulfoferrodoxin (superoxide reductase-like protein)
MKKILILASICLFVLVQFSVSAHAPSGINASFNSKTGELTLKVMHDVGKSKVKDVSKHFIKSIEIKLNGQALTTLTFDKQETPAYQSAKYKIDKPYKKGDKISITATCSLKGSAMKEIKIN